MNTESTKKDVNTPSSHNDGVLDKDYARQRLTKPAHLFRLQVRGQIVSDLLNRYIQSKAIPEHPSLLDFGAAEGLTMLEVARGVSCERFTGIEYSGELIASAPPLPEKMELLEGDVTCLPSVINDASYDAVIALALLEHLVEPQKAITEAFRVLKPGGLFIASCPHPFWDSVACAAGLLKDGDHETDMYYGTMKTLLSDAGFTKITYDRFMWAPVSFLPYLSIKVAAKTAIAIDRVVNCIPLINLLSVNQLFTAQKP